MNFNILNTISIVLLILGLGLTSIYIYDYNNVALLEPAVDATADERDIYIKALPSEELSQNEKEALVYMIQEEKLARDVYRAFYVLYPIQPFMKIPNSEELHMAALRSILEKYNLEDPTEGDALGFFDDQLFQDLYDELYTNGSVSKVEALKVGEYIEELDIMDLRDFNKTVDNEDIYFVFNYLMYGSLNHLGGFAKQLALIGESYTPVLLQQVEYDEIIAREHTHPVATTPKEADDNWLVFGIISIVLGGLAFGFGTYMRKQGI